MRNEVVPPRGGPIPAVGSVTVALQAWQVMTATLFQLKRPSNILNYNCQQCDGVPSCDVI